MGSVLTAGSSVRIRPVDGGNETQVLAPAEGRFYVKGLESGSYVAVDELGNRRAFTVTQGTGEEVELEDFAAVDAPEPEELPANYGTDAPAVRDESHEIQGGLPAMTVSGATLTRGGSENPADLSPVAEVAPTPTDDNENGVEDGSEVAPEDDPEHEPEELKGDALDARAAELEIEGRSSMTADEKRTAIANEEKVLAQPDPPAES